MDLFSFKKLVGPIFFPMFQCMFWLGVGLVLLWFTKRQRLGKILITISACVLSILSMEPVATGLLSSLESQYGVFSPEAHPNVEVKWIVVISGGFSQNKALPPNSRLGGTTLSRVVEGIRLHQAYPQSRMLFSGGPPDSSAAAVMRETAIMLGVDSAMIDIEPNTRDTKDEALRVKDRLGSDRFILVTSATHLPRAMALFRKQGLDPLPAPTEFMGGDGDPFPQMLFPDSNDLSGTRAVFYEYLGLWWSRLRGQV